MAKKHYDAPDRRLKKFSGDIVVNSYPYEVFVGQLVNWKSDTKRPVIAVETLEGATYEMQHNYDNKAFMSLDGLVRPVSMDGDGSLPRYIVKTGASVDPIQQDDLNPFTNPQGFSRSTVASSRSDTPHFGHDIEIVGRDGSDDGTPENGLIMPVAGFTNSGVGDYTNDYRFLALRGPLVMQSWGYDTEGYPVPNKVDNETDAAAGMFETESLDATKFMDGHLKKPHTWPVAPIDLRLDRARGVWVASGSGTTTPEEPDLGEVRLIAIKSAYNPSCCSYQGFYRQIDWTDPEDMCLTSGQFVDVWLHKFCDTLGPPSIANTKCWCVLGRKEETATFCSESGRPLFDFLSLASDCDDLTPCDCCCPDYEVTKLVKCLITVDTNNCNISKEVTLEYQSGIEIDLCGGGTWSPVGVGPGPGFLGDFTLQVNYPNVLYAVDAETPTGGEILWLATNYTSWTTDGIWIDLGAGLVPYNDTWEWNPLGVNNGLCKILTDDATTYPICQSTTLHYKIFVDCSGGGTSLTMRTLVFHMTPPEYSGEQNVSIGDPGTWEYVEPCMLNTNSASIGLQFGYGDCTASIETLDSSGNTVPYIISPFSFHYFGMCHCDVNNQPDISVGGLGVDYYPCPASAGSCDGARVSAFTFW